ncbi:MMPL family transporter [Streptomyces physcomitrii]|uniref:MMPL family transporter n=1 Tax=Streptomyces physcomitrii TaxID=2724184 RepID=A0ABX1GYN8_9ACTN|nr:MMPL family transporter [Streptomyces physcomitrii]NKI39931.1 MMPL family transporter [Streptomyces physcomitrii]
MERLTDWVLRHRLLVAGIWLVTALAGALLAPTTTDRLSYTFALPGQPGYETNVRIAETYRGGGSTDPLAAVVEGADAPRRAAALGRAVREAVPGTRVVTAAEPGAGALTAKDGRTSVALLYPPVTPGAEPYAAAQPRVEAVVERAGAGVELTGFLLLAEGGNGEDDRGVLVEVVLGAAGALVVLALVFGSLLAGVPLLVAAVSILATFLALLGLTTLTDVSFVVQYLVGLIGLGVAIDYSLLVVTRWREERAEGRENDAAVREAMRTAGRSVLFSGVTVAVSLAALVLVPLPFLRSIGLGGLLIPLLSVATSLTLVPALLSAWGPRLQWPRRKPADGWSRFWAAIARGVLRRRLRTVLGCTAVLLALGVPVLGLSLGSPQLSGLGSDSPASRAATAAVEGGVPEGFLRPVEVLAPCGAGDQLTGELRKLPGVAAAAAPRAGGWSADGDCLLQVYLDRDPASGAGKAALDRIREAVDEHGGGARVGGSPAEDADFVHAVYRDVVWVVLAVVVVTFLLLAKALRSLWLPVKALVLNAISLAAAYGVTVLIWQHGWGSELLFGQQASGAVTTWVPIAVFAFLFGLSMDYEVFILARMRESYDAHGDTGRAVVDGIARTGRLVTSAALILFLAFVALATVPAVEVKILATALALGIVIDAVIVRGLLAPALVGLFGRINWTLPDRLARLLRIGGTTGSPGVTGDR